MGEVADLQPSRAEDAETMKGHVWPGAKQPLAPSPRAMHAGASSVDSFPGVQHEVQTQCRRCAYLTEQGSPPQQPHPRTLDLRARQRMERSSLLRWRLPVLVLHPGVRGGVGPMWGHAWAHLNHWRPAACGHIPTPKRASTLRHTTCGEDTPHTGAPKCEYELRVLAAACVRNTEGCIAMDAEPEGTGGGCIYMPVHLPSRRRSTRNAMPRSASTM